MRRQTFVVAALGLIAVAVACNSFSGSDGSTQAPVQDAGTPSDSMPATEPPETAAPPADVVAPPPADPFVEASGGYFASCARTRSGKVYCWGETLYGTDGNQNAATGNCLEQPGTCQFNAVPVVGVEDAIQISVGVRHACALRKNGTIMCWGENYYDELGFNLSDPQHHFTATTVPNIVNAREIAAGQYATCAIVAADADAAASTNQVVCWGLYNEALVGPPPPYDASTPLSSMAPLVIAGLQGAVHVSMGLSYLACANLADNSVKCWGVNYAQLMGDAGNVDICLAGVCTPTPVQLNGFTATNIAVGSGLVCGITLANSVECVGFNAFGTFGNGAADNGNHLIPTPVAGLSDVTQLSARFQHVCAIANGQPLCWGGNLDGAFGSFDAGDTAPCITGGVPYRCLRLPTRPIGLEDTITSIWAGVGDTYAIGPSGLVAAGSNGFGQLARSPDAGDAVFDAGCQENQACSPHFAPIVPSP